MSPIDFFKDIVFRYNNYENAISISLDYEQKNIALLSQLSQLQDQINNNTISTKELKSKIQSLNKNLELINYWENKYPHTQIYYNARPLPASTINIQVPVNVFITPNDAKIISDLKSWNLYKTGEDFETLIPKIYKNIFNKYYKYFSDVKTFGLNECWLFPFEVFELRKQKKGVDCEDWAHFQQSYYEAAGIEPTFCRCVAGETNIMQGGLHAGHCTVYVFSEITGQFHHLNSTYGNTFKNKISLYPTHKDAELKLDNIGIQKVWFSYNSKTCYSNFDSKNESEIIKDYIIKNN